MLHPLAAIGSAIAARLGSVPGTISLYQDVAVQGSAPPYAVYSYQTGVDLYTWDGSETQTEYQIKVVSDKENSAEATLLYSSLHGAIQDAPLTMPNGVTLLRCRRVAPVKYQDAKRFWHVGGLYRIDILE